MPQRITTPIIVDLSSRLEGVDDACPRGEDLSLVIKLVSERLGAEYGAGVLVPIIVTYSKRPRKVARVVRINI